MKLYADICIYIVTQYVCNCTLKYCLKLIYKAIIELDIFLISSSMSLMSSENWRLGALDRLCIAYNED